MDSSTDNMNEDLDCRDTEHCWNIYYDSITPIGGFQFDVVGITIKAATGGASEEAGFSVITSSNRILGFSFSGGSISAGNSVLVQTEYEGDISMACLSNPIISDSYGESIDVEIIETIMKSITQAKNLSVHFAIIIFEDMPVSLIK